MTDTYLQITRQFDFLKDFGLHFTYIQSKGKLDDRDIQKFTYDNPTLQRKFEIVYCTANVHPILYGSLIKYSSTNKNPQDPESNIPFTRLRCFFEEGSDIIFFGNEQYDFSYKLKEFKLVIEKFINCVTSVRWIDYNELLANESKIYTLTLEPKDNYLWAEQIKSDNFIKKETTTIYDSSNEPPYEAFGLRIKAKNDIVFHITHGYKSRDEDGCSVQIIRPNSKTENHEFMNEGTNKVIEFIRQTVST
jgi:hypothetical protein